MAADDNGSASHVAPCTDSSDSTMTGRYRPELTRVVPPNHATFKVNTAAKGGADDIVFHVPGW